MTSDERDAELMRWRHWFVHAETLLDDIQRLADGGGMAGHDGAEDIRRFRAISDLVDRIWTDTPPTATQAGQAARDA